MNDHDHEELNNYLKSISCFDKKIDKEKEKALFEIIAKNPTGIERDKAIQELVESNLFLVVNLAIKKSRNGIDVMDLVYEGNLALYNAANDYISGHESGASFCTCAFTYISNAMLNTVKNRLMYLPKVFNHYEIAISSFEAKNGREASPKDIMELFDVTIERARAIRRALNAKVSSVEALSSEDSTWEDIYGEKDSMRIKKMLQLDLSVFIDKLDPLQKKVVELIYLGNDELDFVEVGKIMGCSKQYACVICQSAMRELKWHMINAWNKENKTKIFVMRSNDTKNKKSFKKRIDAEEKANRKAYREVLAHYLEKNHE